MSQDRTTEILNYLTAISRDVGELRAEVKQLDKRLEQIEARVAQIETRVEMMDGRLERIEREQKRQGRRLERIEGWTQMARAGIEDLQERMLELEEKQA